jgi:hypothetical protein
MDEKENVATSNPDQGDSSAITDEHILAVRDDPRKRGDQRRGKAELKRGKGMNTSSFDPKSTLVRPDVRIIVGPKREDFNKKLKHDDVVLVPEFFCSEDDWSIYYKLIDEMRELHQKDEKGSEWISWHEGAHLISKNPKGSPSYQAIIDKMATYYGIEKKSVGTRFNWYTSSDDWKPFHHDSAAFNPERARNQNITVGASFGSCRELGFYHAKSDVKAYFPQGNGMMMSFGRDVNINFKVTYTFSYIFDQI